MKSLIEIQNVTLHFGPTEIFDEASVILGEKQKIGVIGRNGAGKSTLCHLITKTLQPDRGTIRLHRELRLGYLEQHDPFQPDETVEQFLMRYTGRADWECGQVAGDFQLKNERFESTPIRSLSGGYQTRVKLAAMLLKEPNFLILDEPTNFLDLQTLILLEEFLRGFPGGYIIVSHDREFLKQTCEHTLEVDNGDLTLYPGDVESYLTYKDEQRQQTLSYNRNVELKQKELQKFIDRFGAKASKAASAQSKQKALDKLQTINIDHHERSVNIQMPEIPEKKGTALRCDDLVIGYPEKKIADNIHLHLKRGGHYGVVGENGQGKTTFLKTLAGLLDVKGGSFKWGHELTVGYYAQNVYGNLDPKQTVQGHLESMAAPGVIPQQILNMAGSFLFRGDDVKKKIAVLSGGERARLCLAGLLLSKKQVLLLDEPTNHLDFETVEALGESLRGYMGTLFFISHDRTFVNLTATEIIEVKDGKVALYHGTYEQYVQRLHEPEDDAPKKAAAKVVVETKPETKADYENRKRRQAEITKLQSQAKKAEAEVTKKTAERQAILNDFAQNPQAYSHERNRRLQQLEEELRRDENQWLELQGKVETLQKEIKP